MGAGADQGYEQEASIPAAPPASTAQKTAKNDEIKMWAVSVSAINKRSMSYPN